MGGRAGAFSGRGVKVSVGEGLEVRVGAGVELRVAINVGVGIKVLLSSGVWLGAVTCQVPGISNVGVSISPAAPVIARVLSEGKAVNNRQAEMKNNRLRQTRMFRINRDG